MRSKEEVQQRCKKLRKVLKVEKMSINSRAFAEHQLKALEWVLGRRKEI